MLGKLWDLHGHPKLQVTGSLQGKYGVAGLAEGLLEGAQTLAILSIEEDQAALCEIQQSADTSRNVRHKDVRFHAVMEQLEPTAVTANREVE